MIMNHNLYTVTIEYSSGSGIGPYTEKITYVNCKLKNNGSFTRQHKNQNVVDGKIVNTYEERNVLYPPTNMTEEVKIVKINQQQEIYHV